MTHHGRNCFCNECDPPMPMKKPVIKLRVWRIADRHGNIYAFPKRDQYTIIAKYYGIVPIPFVKIAIQRA